MAIQAYPYMLTNSNATFTGKEEVISTGTPYQAIGISISIRIGMVALVALFAISEFIGRVSQW